MAHLPTIVATLLLACSPVMAETIVGTATVIDGDTLEIKGKRIRLEGIDAPESAQNCQDAAGKDWRCGQRAALALSDRIARRPTSCEVRDTDRYGRSVAVCSVGRESLNAWMVSQGWALAYREYSKDYVGAEAIARETKVGIWAGAFQSPWKWRREQKFEKSENPSGRLQQ